MTEAEEREYLRYLELKAKAEGAGIDSTSGPPPQAATPKVGVAETALAHWSDALPAGQVLRNALAAGMVKGLRGIGAVPTPSTNPGLMDTYRDIRDRADIRTAAGAEQNPIAAGVSTAAGVGTSLALPLPKLTVGAGRTGRVLSNALTAGAYGGVNKATNGRADLTRGEFLQLVDEMSGSEDIQNAVNNIEAGRYGRGALDVMGAGVPGGFVTGGTLGGLVEGGQALASRIPGAAQAVKDVAISAGRRVLTNGADSLSRKAPIAEETVEEAIRSGGIRSFSTTPKTLERLQGLTEEEGAKYVALVRQLKDNGVEGPRAQEIARQLIAKGRKEWATSGSDKSIAQRYLNEADNAESLATLRNPIPAAPAERLGLDQSLAVTRKLQDEAKHGNMNETLLNRARRDVASTYRQGIEDSVDEAARLAPEGSAIPPLAEQFVPVKQRLSRLIDAESAAERGAARVAQRGAVSPEDKLIGAMGIVSGNPTTLTKTVAAGAANHLIKNRGRSALAVHGLDLADFLANKPADSRAATLRAQLLIAELLRKPSLTPRFGSRLATEEEAARYALLPEAP